jgi:hypothetical protein
MFGRIKSFFSSVKQKVSSIPTFFKSAFAGGGLVLVSSVARADTAADITGAFTTGQTNLGTAVTGLFGLLALVVAIGLIYKIMNK